MWKEKARIILKKGQHWGGGEQCTNSRRDTLPWKLYHDSHGLPLPTQNKLTTFCFLHFLMVDPSLLPPIPPEFAIRLPAAGQTRVTIAAPHGKEGAHAIFV
jgi:hypothetical protein